MYNPAAFKITDSASGEELVRRHSFATIVGIIDGVAHLAYAPTLFLPGASVDACSFIWRAQIHWLKFNRERG
jgi:predicted FMN-binding regulatory protein PaiB